MDSIGRAPPVAFSRGVHVGCVRSKSGGAIDDVGQHMQTSSEGRPCDAPTHNSLEPKTQTPWNTNTTPRQKTLCCPGNWETGIQNGTPNPKLENFVSPPCPMQQPRKIKKSHHPPIHNAFVFPVLPWKGGRYNYAHPRPPTLAHTGTYPWNLYNLLQRNVPECTQMSACLPVPNLIHTSTHIHTLTHPPIHTRRERVRLPGHMYAR